MMEMGAPFAAVVIGDAARGGEEAVALAGGRVVARVGWSEALDPALLDSRAAVLLAKLEGVADEVLDAVLPRVASAGLSVVATLTLAQVDLAFGVLPDAELLVAPTMLERVAALAVAAGRPGRSPGLVREGEEAEPWRGQVARIAEQLARIARDEPVSGAVADRRTGYGAEPGDEPVDPAAIRRTIRARRLRNGFLGGGDAGGGLFEDPAWDMLLDLFAAGLEGGRVSVSSLCIAAAVAPTTALRWIGRLSDAGLLAREADPGDRRRAFVALSERAQAGMAGYVAAVQRAGLPIA